MEPAPGAARGGRSARLSHVLLQAAGFAVLAAGAVVARRRPRPPDPSRPGGGILSRLVSSPAPLTALVVGMLVFTPALTFIAAIQVIATARAGLPLSAVGVTMVVVINAALVWLPFLAYLAAPELTSRKLTAFNAWLLAHPLPTAR